MTIKMNPGNGAGQPSSTTTVSKPPTFRRKRCIVMLSLTALAAWLGQAQGQTFVCGNVSGTWTKANSPYLATCSLIVPAGETLTMQPGVTLKFAQGLGMAVYGNVVASGTPAERITISGTSASFYWAGITVSSAGGDQSSFINCDIINATNALSLTTPRTGNALVAPQIQSCMFSNCLDTCIYGEARAGFEWGPTLNGSVANSKFVSASNGIHLVVSSADGRFQSSLNTVIANNLFKSLSGVGVWFDVSPEAQATVSSPKAVNNVFTGCAVGMKKDTDPASAPSFNPVVSHNCLYSNTTNFAWNPAGVYGVISGVNARGTNCDIGYNIFENPQFCETTNYTLLATSPCIDAGNPAPAYLDSCMAAAACQPGSLGTTVNDIGIWGGPYACTSSNNFTLTAQRFLGVTIYPTAPGLYRLEYRPNVDTGIWTQLTVVCLASTPYTYIDYDYPAVGKRFYRAVLVGPCP